VLITLSGLPGSGTSTVARNVSSRLGIEHLDGGTVFRTMASEHGLSLGEFARRAEVDDTIDRALDDRLVARAREGGVLLESRLAGWLVTRGDVPALRVWISCDDRERARRVGERDGHDLDEALATNTAREASERLRYQTYYDIDLADLSIYDLVVDSTDASPDQVTAQVLVAVGGPHP
jgi:predicted cytidylate kinase